ncbi:MAG: hypothetical protein ACYC4L_02155, partial [Chloroflexota bacterium]
TLSKQALLALLAAGGSMVGHNLFAALPSRLDQTSAALAFLEDLALLVRAGDEGGARVEMLAEVRAALIIVAAARLERPERPQLLRSLERLSRPQLERLSSLWGLAGHGELTRSALLAALVRSLSARSETRRAAASLSPAARRLLIALHRSSGVAEATDLSSAANLDELSLREALAEARDLFPLQVAYNGGRRWLLLPTGLGDLAEPGANDSPLLPLLGGGPSQGANEYGLAVVILHLLDYLRSADPPVTSLPLSRQHAHRLSKSLTGIVLPEGLAFATAAAHGLHLLEECSGRICVSARADAWEKLEHPAQTLALLGWWRRTERWREGLRASDTAPGGPIDFPAGREHLLAALGRLRPGSWYSEAGFLGWLRHHEPLLYRDVARLRLAGGAQAVDRVAQHWPNWDGRLARAALVGPLFWLGLLARQGDSRSAAFAVTPLGAWLLGLPEACLEEALPDPPLQIAASGDIALRSPNGPALAVALRYASWRQGGHLRLDGESLARTARAGLGPEVVLRDLSAHADLTPEVAAAVRRWMAALHPLRVRRAVLLEARQSETVDHLLRSAWARRLRLQRLTPTLALVEAPEELAGQRERLRRDGFLLTDSGEGAT